MHTGAMVALIPSAHDAQRLAVEGGEPAEQLHLTLHYLGKGDDFSPETRAVITELVRAHTADLPAVQADAFSVAVFNPRGDEPAIVLGVGGQPVWDAYTAACTALAGLADLPAQHTPWCAHVTLHFTADASLVADYTDRTGPITFDRIRVAFAGEHADIPLTPPEPEPRAGFGGTLLPARSDPMPEERQMHYGRAFADADRGWADEPAGSPVPFVASTMGVQRDNLDLRASGWKLDNFRRNSVFLWCHDYRSEPLGNVRAFTDIDRLRSDVLFDQEDDRARRIESKYRRGFLNAVSVGWDFVDAEGRQMEWWRLSAEQMRDEAFYDLLELSGVPVPADPNALALRQRTALRALGTELVALYDEQENPDSDVTAPELRAAVRAELVRIGIDPEPGILVGGELEEIRAEPLVATLDEQALARAIRAAFGDVLKVDDRIDQGAITVNEWRARDGKPAVVWNGVPGETTTTGSVASTTVTVRTDTPPDDEPPTAGVREPADTPVPPDQDSAARAVDNDAAQVLLAAFNI